MKLSTIIKILFLFFLTTTVSGCSTQDKSVSKPGPSIYDGSIGLVLGCMFNPADCKKMKQEMEQDQITKEFEEVDQAVNSQKQ